MDTIDGFQAEGFGAGCLIIIFLLSRIRSVWEQNYWSSGLNQAFDFSYLFA